METNRTGLIAVIFRSVRTGEDEAGYRVAAAEMEALAAAQPGYAGFASGNGISVSYWQDEAAALAWRAHPDHAGVREAGRDRWYSAYQIDVARIERSYDWSRDG